MKGTPKTLLCEDMSPDRGGCDPQSANVGEKLFYLHNALKPRESSTKYILFAYVRKSRGRGGGKGSELCGHVRKFIFKNYSVLQFYVEGSRKKKLGTGVFIIVDLFSKKKACLP